MDDKTFEKLKRLKEAKERAEGILSDFNSGNYNGSHLAVILSSKFGVRIVREYPEIGDECDRIVRSLHEKAREEAAILRKQYIEWEGGE